MRMEMKAMRTMMRPGTVQNQWCGCGNSKKEAVIGGSQPRFVQMRKTGLEPARV
jgi:hypothetical protein